MAPNGGRDAMLAGAWSAFSSGNNAPAYVSNTAARTGAHSLRFDHNGLSTSSTEARRALNGPKFVVGLGFGLYMFNLPPLNNLIGIELRSTSNARVIRLSFQSDGSLTAYNAAGVAVAVSDPVMGASSWNHIEIKAVIDTIVGSVEVRVNGVTVIMRVEPGLRHEQGRPRPGGAAPPGRARRRGAAGVQRRPRPHRDRAARRHRHGVGRVGDRGL